jgi:hypothetical protein
MKMLRITSQAAALQLGIAGSVAHAQAAPGNPASCPTGSIPTNESSITIRQSRNGSVSTHHLLYGQIQRSEHEHRDYT